MFKLIKITKQNHKVETEAQIAENSRECRIFIDICEHNGLWEARLMGKDVKWLLLPVGIPQYENHKFCKLQELTASEKRLYKIALRVLEVQNLTDFFDK